MAAFVKACEWGFRLVGASLSVEPSEAFPCAASDKLTFTL